jgi:hypothetical protein
MSSVASKGAKHSNRLKTSEVWLNTFLPWTTFEVRFSRYSRVSDSGHRVFSYSSEAGEETIEKDFILGGLWW